MILTVAQQKGGAGKTTLLVQLATALAARGQTVGVVDIDPQASLTGWMRLREHEGRHLPELRLSMIGGWRLAAELDRLRRDVDMILIDTAGQADTEAKVAMRAADRVLVPMQPSASDQWATRTTLALAAKENRPALVVLNRVPPRSRAVDEVIESVEREGWPICPQRLGNRQSYVACFARGQGVIEGEPKSAAAQEVHALLEALLG